MEFPVAFSVVYSVALPQVQLNDTGIEWNKQEKRTLNQIDLQQLAMACPAVRFLFREQTESTNDWALEWLSEQKESESEVSKVTVFLTSRQTAGRGRGSNRWLSSAGSLTLTLLIPNSFSLDDQRRNLIPLAVGNQLCVALEDYATKNEIVIKWPNDIYWQDRKLAGVLVESARNGTVLVIGCGLNVNNETTDISDSVSMKELTGRQIPMTALIEKVVNLITSSIQKLETESDLLLAELRVRDALFGKPVLWINGDHEKTAEGVEGTARGIAGDGSLLLEIGGETVNVQTINVHSGSIRAIKT